MFNVDERTSVKTARTSLRPRLHSMIHVEIHVCGGHPWLVTFRLCSLIRVIVAVTVTDWEDFCLCCFLPLRAAVTRRRPRRTAAPARAGPAKIGRGRHRGPPDLRVPPPPPAVSSNRSRKPKSTPRGEPGHYYNHVTRSLCIL